MRSLVLIAIAPFIVGCDAPADGCDAPVNVLDAPSWATARYPMVVGHRGAAAVRPENTFAAFDYAAAHGVPLETDVASTRDGFLVHMHDPTTARTCGTNLTVEMSTLAVLSALDCSYTFPGPGNVYVPQKIPTFHAWLQRYAAGSLLLPEVKDEKASTAIAMASWIRSCRAQPQTIVQSFSAANLISVKFVDPAIKTALTSPGLVTPAELTAAGAYAAFVPHNLVDASYVNSVHSIGAKVFAFHVRGIADVDAMVAAGVDVLAMDDPEYGKLLMDMTPTGTTTIAVPSAYVAGAGWLDYSAPDAHAVVTTGYSSFAPVATLTDAAYFRIQLPVRTAGLPATQTFTTTLRADQATATTTRYMGFHICWTIDDDTNWNGGTGKTPNGYMFAYRRNGTVELSKVLSGSGTTIATDTTWDPYGVGSVIPLRVDVTAAAVTVTRTDNNKTLTANNAEAARGGLFQVVGSGVVPAIGPTTVTY